MNHASIGDLVYSVRSWNPQREAPGQFINYIDLSAIDNDTKSITNHETVLACDAPSRARQKVQSGDILVSTVRPYLNGVARVPPQLNGATASTGFCVIRADESKIIAEYLFQWVKSPQFVADMTKKATGASYPAVSDRIVLDSKIPLPSLNEQRRIAAILDQADALCRTRNAADHIYDRMEATIFEDTFGNPRTNPKALGKQILGELISVSSGIGLTAAEQKGGLYPVYGGNGINGFHNEFRVPRGTIIIGRVGVYCGAVHVTAKNAWVTDNALVVTVNADNLTTSYLAAALKFANLNQYAGRSAQPLVSGNRIYPVEVLVPPLVDQKRFETSVAKLDRLSNARRDVREKLALLFGGLQARAFEGAL